MLASVLALALAGVTTVAWAAKDDLDLISRADGTNGAKANAFSADAALSADGRFVAFDSFASNLAAADGDNIDDVFVRDSQTNTNTLVSRASGAGGAKGNVQSVDPTISANGRFVAFTSGASNLDPADVDATSDVYVRDLQTNTTRLVSRASGADGAKGNDTSAHPAISADGRFVAFDSFARNLDPADGFDLANDVYVRDLQTNTTTLVSRPSGADGVDNGGAGTSPSISADGRFVAFTSRASTLDPADGDRIDDVFVRDLQTNTTRLVSRASGTDGAKGDGQSLEPVISADARFVTFTSAATNLDSTDNEMSKDVFIRDLQTNTTTLVSRATGADGAKENGAADGPAISADGRYVAFRAFNSNLAPAGSGVFGAIYVRDRQANTTTLVSRAAGAAGAAGNNISQDPAISGDGRFVAFGSFATNLDPADGDDGEDLFRRDVLGTADQAARISIDDVSLAEGNTGQTAFRFTVSLDQAQAAPVSVDFATANGAATAPSDYLAAAGTATFAPGETTRTVTVQVNGDADVEPDETFNVNLANATGNAAIADATGVGTIVNDDQPVLEQPSRISIDDFSTTEGNAGQTAFRFNVALDKAQSAPVTVDFATADGTATAPSDYAANTATLIFAPGETAKPVTVQVNGDTTKELDETFNVSLANATGNATIADATGVGTIINDDQPVVEQPARISIGDVTMAEGDTGPSAFVFTVSLDSPHSSRVAVDFATADGSATAPGDYSATTGTLTFAPGATAERVTVEVNGDTRREPDETFGVNLLNIAGNATIADGHAVGTIANDDRKGKARKFALGKLRLNRRTGTATLSVAVPGPGKLAISGNGVKAASVVLARSARAPRTARLPVRATGESARRLSRTGGVTVRPHVTYTPIGGTPNTRSTSARLERL